MNKVEFEFQECNAYRDPDSWLRLRQDHIGGSDVAKIMGVSPFGSPLTVFYEKTGITESAPPTEKMLWAQRMEPVVSDWFAEQHPEYRVVETTCITGPGPRMATPDRLLVQDDKVVGILEIKCPGMRALSYWVENDQIVVPDDARLQAEWYMARFGVEKAYVVPLVGGEMAFCAEFERDQRREEAVDKYLMDWWERYVVGKEEPPADASDACTEALKLAHPDHDDEIRTATAVEQDLILRLKTAKERLDVAQMASDEIKNKLRQAIGDNLGIVCAGGKVTWKRNKDSVKVSYKDVIASLREQSAEIQEMVDKTVATFTEIKPGPRVLRPTWAKRG